MRYDLDLVKSAADGRWSEILSILGGVDASLLDGGHHSCPKQCHPDAGGKDRFRALDDFRQSGAVICNQCFATRNGDGLAALQWLTGEDFQTCLAKVAKYVGVNPIKGRKRSNPSEHLSFLPWNKTLVGLWCNQKKPIKADGLQRIGARVAKYRKQYTVIAIPVWGPALDAEDPVGWIIYRFDGGQLPKYRKKDEPPEWVKVKLTAGSQQGLVTDLTKWKDTSTTRTWVKVEGSTDLATMESQDWPESTAYGFFTTANGAQEKPLDWIVDRLKDADVMVVHDCDTPGQNGATFVLHTELDKKRPGWCPVIAEVAKSVRNVVLPFTIEPVHGSDVRDYFSGGATCEDFIDLADKSPVWDLPIEVAENWIEKAEDDQNYLASINLAKYRKSGRNLVNWRNEFLQFKGNRYEMINTKALRIRIRASIQDHFDQLWLAGKRDKPARKVTSMLVNEVMEATSAMSYVDDEVEFNSWMSCHKNKWDRKPESESPKNCVALANGVLCMDKLFAGKKIEEYLLQHTPEWFSTICLPYAYDPLAKCPTWEAFLEDVFNKDELVIETISRWFGYQLIDDMSLEKIAMFIGQPRSGKGTIMKTLIELLGRASVASPSLNSFADQYFLHSLLGKTAVVIPDVRLSRRADNVMITERVLSISGRDPQDIQRKYLDTLNGVNMQCRFTLFSNMLPYFEDHSAAFVKRCIFFSMPNTYYGREDHHLFQKIKKEMPGILNWAIAGRYRLEEDRRAGLQPLVQPPSGEYLARQMNVLSAPVDVFLKDRTVLVSDSEASTGIHELFEEYCQWCAENDRVKKMDQEQFRRAVRDAYPNLPVRNVKWSAHHHSRIFGMQIKKVD